MDEALRAAGIDRRPFVQGDIWWVNDEAIFLPTSISGNRTSHPERPVVIMDGPSRCADASLTYILAAPTSHLVDRASRYQVTLVAGQGGLTADTVILVDLLQPIPRKAFARRIGSLLDTELDSLKAIMLDNLGILPE